MNFIKTIIIDSSRYGSRNFIKIYFKDPRFRAVFLFRISNLLFRYRMKFIARMFSNYISIRYGFQTRPDLNIKEGIKLVHLGGVIIHGDCQIGRNFTILNNVTIGQRRRKDLAVPKIGNNVFIGTQTILLGGCSIGNNVSLDAGLRISHDIKNSSRIINNNFIEE